MPRSEPITVPLGYPTATFFIDESGSQSDRDYFVMAAVKTREPGRLARAIHAVRERHDDYDRELKFSRVSRDALPIYTDVIAAA